MNKRSRHGRKHTAKKERKGKKAYRKGSKSKTMKGKKDFTTKKSSKVFNRRRHYQKHAKGSRVVRKPYHKKRGGTTQLSPADYNKAYNKHGHVNLAKHHSTTHKSEPLARTLDVGLQTWNFDGKAKGKSVILTNAPLTAGEAAKITGKGLTAGGLITALNKTLKDNGVTGKDMTFAPGRDVNNPDPRMFVLSSSAQSNFYKGNSEWITPELENKIKKDPTLQHALGKTMSEYLASAETNGTVFGVPNTATYWANQLA